MVYKALIKRRSKIAFCILILVNFNKNKSIPKMSKQTNNIKILQLVRHNCAAFGFSLYQSTTQKYPINWKSLQAIFLICLAFYCSCAYFFLEANTFEEYTSSAYVSMTLMLIIALYLIFIWKNQSMAQLLHNVEKIVNERENEIFRCRFYFRRYFFL